MGLVVRRCPGVGTVVRGWLGLGGGQQLEAVVRSGCRGGISSPGRIVQDDAEVVGLFFWSCWPVLVSWLWHVSREMLDWHVSREILEWHVSREMLE